MKIAVITDSASNLLPEFVKKHNNLFVVPLMIVVDGVSYRDQVEITADKVYAQLDTHDVKTSLPNMDDVTKLLAELKKKEYTDILVLNLSSGLSGTFNAMRLALENEKDLNVTHIDTKTLGGGLGYIVEYALDLVEKKTPVDDIVKALDELRYKDSLAIYTINTLKYLKKGGRIGKVEGTIGDILHVKPVITVNDDGVYITLSKAFGLKRSLLSMKNLMVEKFGQDLIDLTVHYGDDPVMAAELGDKMIRELNVRNLILSPLTPVLGIHTGPMMFAYVARRIK